MVVAVLCRDDHTD